MITIKLPIPTVSLLNSREHWSKKARRASDQRYTTRLYLKNNHPEFPFTINESSKIIVKITRIGKRKLDSDNLAGSQKHIRDGIADYIGIDDGSSQFDWQYDQIIDNKDSGNSIVQINVL